MKVMPRTMIVLRNIIDGNRWRLIACEMRPTGVERLFLLYSGGFGGGIAVFLQLIMQGFQTYSENFRGAGLVIAGRLEGLQDEHFFGLFNGCTNAETHSVRVVGRGP